MEPRRRSVEELDLETVSNGQLLNIYTDKENYALIRLTVSEFTDDELGAHHIGVTGAGFTLSNEKFNVTRVLRIGGPFVVERLTTTRKVRLSQSTIQHIQLIVGAED